MMNPSGCTLVQERCRWRPQTDLRNFLPFEARCGCSYSKCYQMQCVHGLSKYGKVVLIFLRDMVIER